MKKQLAFGLLLLSIISPAISQTFEGTIRVGVDIQVGTAEETAVLEASVKDPLRAQLENERKMLANSKLNPEERAILENLVKEHEELVSRPLMKTYSDAKIKGDHMIVTYRGGKSSRLYRNNGQSIFDISHRDKTYKSVDGDKSKSWGNGAVLVKTDETDTILNYPCTKYVITSEKKGEKTETTVWATPDITDVKWTVPLDYSNGDSVLISQIKGTPLKIVALSAKVKTVTEILAIERSTFVNEDFLLPAGYSEAAPKGKGKKKK